MSLFSRCDASHRFGPDASTSARLARPSGIEGAPRAVIATFIEELGILFRYAAGLDYYGRNALRGKP